MVAPVMLTAEQVAERVGSITPATWRRYVYAGRAPAPDGYTGRTPTWRASTITEWVKARPGRGAGGGRPRKVQPEVPGQQALPGTEPATAVT